MGKKKPPRHVPPRSPRPRVAGGDLTAAIHEAVARLDALAQAAQSDPLAQRFALDELAAAAAAAAADLAEHGQDLLAAVEIDRAGVPLARTYPTGDLWTGPQRPRYLPGLARRASEDDQPTTYAARLDDAELAAELDPTCPRPTADGGRCYGQRVRLAGRRRAEACWTHLTAARKTQIRGMRDQAVAAHACRTCHAPAGTPCEDPAGKPTQPHTARLDA